MADILYEELVGLNYNPTNDIDDELPPEYVVLYLKNKSTIDKKIIVEPIPLQQILLSNQNPSLRLIDNKAVFCLSPPSMQEISCEGATNSISFPSLVGAWTVLFGDIDGEPNVVEGDINGIITGLDSLPEFESSSDGSIYIGNVSDSHVRFKFVPHDNDDPVPSYIAPTDNPTFMEHDDGSLTFCLVAVN